MTDPGQMTPDDAFRAADSALMELDAMARGVLPGDRGAGLYTFLRVDTAMMCQVVMSVARRLTDVPNQENADD